MKFLIVSYALLLLLLSCSSKTEDTKKEFVQIIGDSLTTSQALDFSKHYNEQLNLPNILNGVDSVEIRFWSFSFFTRKDLFTLRYSKGKWIATNYEFYSLEHSGDSLIYMSKKIVDDTAIRLINFLSDSLVLQLPTQTEVPDFRDNTADGISYFLEISTNKFYKFLNYRNPSRYNDKYNKTFIRVLDSITTVYPVLQF